MRWLRILLCTPYNGASDKNPGGIVIWSRNIMQQHIQELNNEIEVDLLPADRNTYIHDHMSRFQRICIGIYEYWQIIIRLKEKLRDEKYDMLHLSTSASLGLFKDYVILHYALKKGLRTVIHFHFGRIPQLARSRNWEWKLLVKVCQMADSAIVMDQKSFLTLQNEGLKQVFYLPNPVSPQVEEVKMNKQRIARKVLFVGHVVPAKGVCELVQACSEIENVELHLIGQVQDAMRQQLLELSHHAEWLHVHGGMLHEEAINEMLTCSVLVLPSYSEGFPNVILEGMACRCPIVATNVGAIPEMLYADSTSPAGILVRPKQVEELKNAIVRLLSDDSLSQMMADNAFHRVMELYSPSVVYRQLAEIWKAASC